MLGANSQPVPFVQSALYSTLVSPSSYNQVVVKSLGVTISPPVLVGFDAGDTERGLAEVFSLIDVAGNIVPASNAAFNTRYQLYSGTDNIAYTVWTNCPGQLQVWNAAYDSAGAVGITVLTEMHNFDDSISGSLSMTYPGYFVLSPGVTIKIFVYGLEGAKLYQPLLKSAMIKIHAPVTVSLATVGFQTTDYVRFLDANKVIVAAKDLEYGVEYDIISNTGSDRAASVGCYLQFHTNGWYGGWIGEYDIVKNRLGVKSGNTPTYVIWGPRIKFVGVPIDVYLYGLDYGDVVPQFAKTQYAKVSIY